ncbi:MAG TPA: hypothetical protein VGR06_29505 [Actinophytocola sp.]|jgi:uncharacterized cupin superfamily protein|uniref:hypothetical protein n=1 Tax=Actinophytocola sp. TaxID=1872138 RepID=UPI002DF7C896|nr:hypothetical protein [Actinophytocola sp.]
MTTARVPTAYGDVVDLVGLGADWPYLFVQHTLLPYHAAQFRSHTCDHRTFMVIEGRAKFELLNDAGGIDAARYGHLEGWHAVPGSVYRIVNAGGRPLVFLEAGTATGTLREEVDAAPLRQFATAYRCPPVSYYTVTKPWGHEVWYTHNLTRLPYAMKQIHMSKGHQSSLQSHQVKAETNYVIDGEATVLNGRFAPENLDTVIDPGALPASVHRSRSGWSSAPRVLHRVIARSDYTSIEVSTPELDDVIRWQDDTGRANGRIDTEHLAGRR